MQNPERTGHICFQKTYSYVILYVYLLCTRREEKIKDRTNDNLCMEYVDVLHVQWLYYKYQTFNGRHSGK